MSNEIVHWKAMNGNNLWTTIKPSQLADHSWNWLAAVQLPPTNHWWGPYQTLFDRYMLNAIDCLIMNNRWVQYPIANQENDK